MTRSASEDAGGTRETLAPALYPSQPRYTLLNPIVARLAMCPHPLSHYPSPIGEGPLTNGFSVEQADW